MKQRKATMRDIAEKCGVSKATVSYAFSAPHKIIFLIRRQGISPLAVIML